MDLGNGIPVPVRADALGLAGPLRGERDADAEHGPRGRRLCCAGCGATVTHEGERIVMGGAHEHSFRNPAGLAFDIGCFARAPGCVGSGPSTSEHTWFPGYRWQVALCAACRAHLGWHFRSADGAPFHGLISARLRPGAGSH